MGRVEQFLWPPKLPLLNFQLKQVAKINTMSFSINEVPSIIQEDILKLRCFYITKINGNK
jgi:hypothetical protein